MNEKELEDKNKALEKTAKTAFKHWRSLSKDTLRTDWGDAANEVITCTTHVYSKSTFSKTMRMFSEEALPSDDADLMLFFLKNARKSLET